MVYKIPNQKDNYYNNKKIIAFIHFIFNILIREKAQTKVKLFKLEREMGS